MIDAVVAIILLVFAVAGYHRGLIRSALTLLSSVAALILSFIVYPVINGILKLTPIYTGVYEGTLNRIQGIDFGYGLQSQGNAIVNNITWLPQIITQQIKDNNNAVMYKLLGVDTLQEYIATYVTNIIISLLAILVTWIVIKVVLTGTLRIMGSIIEHLPVISTFNHAGGFIFGIIKGLLTLSVIGLIIPVFIDQPFMQGVMEGIQSSVLTKWLYDNNFILMIYNNYLS